ncbi:MAG: hypothetical protein ACXV2C_07135 [Candidatus Bathyarchaeia archaeon]
MASYTRWINHGEVEDENDDEVHCHDADEGEPTMCGEEKISYSRNIGDDSIRGQSQGDGLDEMLRDAEVEVDTDKDFQKFQRVVKDSKTALYEGCKEEHNKLHVVLTLLQMKASNGWSDKSFTRCSVSWPKFFLTETSYQQQRT